MASASVTFVTKVFVSNATKRSPYAVMSLSTATSTILLVLASWIVILFANVMSSASATSAREMYALNVMRNSQNALPILLCHPDSVTLKPPLVSSSVIMARPVNAMSSAKAMPAMSKAFVAVVKTSPGLAPLVHFAMARVS